MRKSPMACGTSGSDLSYSVASTNENSESMAYEAYNRNCGKVSTMFPDYFVNDVPDRSHAS